MRGDPGLTVLRVLAVAADAAPIGAAAHGIEGVAAGVWAPPALHLVRWTEGRRRITSYKLPARTAPGDQLADGRIPTRFETGNSFGAAPDEVAAAFAEVGLQLDEAPFPVPPAPVTPFRSQRPTRSERPPRSASSTAAATTRPQPKPSSSPRATKPAAAPRPVAVPTTRLCPSCHMHKHVRQFPDGSDVCADCS